MNRILRYREVLLGAIVVVLVAAFSTRAPGFATPANLAGIFNDTAILIILALAVAGSLVRKQKVPASSGTFPTGTPLFATLLTGVVVIVVGLTYFPVVALGPIVEQLTQGS